MSCPDEQQAHADPRPSRDWQPLALFSLFASPIAHIAPVPGGGTTVAFVSANSPLALVELFPPRILFVLPGTKSAVESISTAGDEMLILYRHGLARVCDVKGLELRRSMDRRTAMGVLAEGGWTTWSVFLSGSRGSSKRY